MNILNYQALQQNVTKIFSNFYKKELYFIVNQAQRSEMLSKVLLICLNIWIIILSLSSSLSKLGNIDQNLKFMNSERLSNIFDNSETIQRINIILIFINVPIATLFIFCMVRYMFQESQKNKRLKKFGKSIGAIIILDDIMNKEISSTKQVCSIFLGMYNYLVTPPSIFLSAKDILSPYSIINFLITFILGYLITDSTYSFQIFNTDCLSLPFSRKNLLLFIFQVIILALISISNSREIIIALIYYLVQIVINIYQPYNNIKVQKMSLFLTLYFTILCVVMELSLSIGFKNITCLLILILIPICYVPVKQYMIQYQKRIYQDLQNCIGNDSISIKSLDRVVRLPLFNNKKCIGQNDNQMVRIMNLIARKMLYYKQNSILVLNYEKKLKEYDQKVDTNNIYSKQSYNFLRFFLKEILKDQYEEEIKSLKQIKDEKQLASYFAFLLEILKSDKLYYLQYQKYMKSNKQSIKGEQILFTIHKNLFVERKLICENTNDYNNPFDQKYTKLIQYEDIFEQTCLNIHKALDLKINICSIMKQKYINLVELKNKIEFYFAQTLTLNKDIRWLLLNNPNSQKLQQLIELYIQNIAFESESEFYRFMNIQTNNSLKNKYNNSIFDRNSCVIMTQYEESEQLKINNVSKNFFKIFTHYKRQNEIINQNIDQFIPKFLHSQHDKYIKNYLLKKNSSISELTEKKILFAQLTPLNIAPVYIDVKVNSYLNEGKYGIIAYIKLINKSNEYILFDDTNFHLLGMTHKLRNIIFPNNQYLNKFNLQTYFPFLQHQVAQININQIANMTQSIYINQYEQNDQLNNQPQEINLQNLEFLLIIPKISKSKQKLQTLDKMESAEVSKKQLKNQNKKLQKNQHQIKNQSLNSPSFDSINKSTLSKNSQIQSFEGSLENSFDFYQLILSVESIEYSGIKNKKYIEITKIRQLNIIQNSSLILLYLKQQLTFLKNDLSSKFILSLQTVNKMIKELSNQSSNQISQKKVNEGGEIVRKQSLFKKFQTNDSFFKNLNYGQDEENNSKEQNNSTPRDNDTFIQDKNDIFITEDNKCCSEQEDGSETRREIDIKQQKKNLKLNINNKDLFDSKFTQKEKDDIQFKNSDTTVGQMYSSQSFQISTTRRELIDKQDFTSTRREMIDKQEEVHNHGNETCIEQKDYFQKDQNTSTSNITTIKDCSRMDYSFIGSEKNIMNSPYQKSQLKKNGLNLLQEVSQTNIFQVDTNQKIDFYPLYIQKQESQKKLSKQSFHQFSKQSFQQQHIENQQLFFVNSDLSFNDKINRTNNNQENNATFTEEKQQGSIKSSISNNKIQVPQFKKVKQKKEKTMNDSQSNSSKRSSTAAIERNLIVFFQKKFHSFSLHRSLQMLGIIFFAGLMTMLAIQTINFRHQMDFTEQNKQIAVWPTDFIVAINTLVKDNNILYALNYNNYTFTSNELKQSFSKKKKADLLYNKDLAINLINQLFGADLDLTSFKIIRESQNTFQFGQYYSPSNITKVSSVPERYVFNYVNYTTSLLYSIVLSYQHTFRYSVGLGTGRPEYYMIQNNKNFVNSLNEVTNILQYQQEDLFENSEFELNLLLIITTLVSVLSVFLIIPLNIYKQTKNQKILSLFATFSSQKIDSYIIQIIKAKQTISSLIFDDNQSQKLTNIQETQYNYNNQLANMKYKNNSNISQTTTLPKISIWFIIKLIFLFLLVIIYPLVNKSVSKSYLNQSSSSLRVLVNLYRIKGYISVLTSTNYINMFMKMFPNIKPIRLNEYVDYFGQLIQQSSEMENILENILQEEDSIGRQIFIQNKKLLLNLSFSYSYMRSEYTNFFYSVLKSDMCAVFKDYPKYISNTTIIDINQCNTLYQGTLRSGFQIAFKQLLQLFPYTYNIQITQDQSTLQKQLEVYLKTFDIKEFTEFEEFLEEVLVSLKDFILLTNKNNYKDTIIILLIMLGLQVLLIILIFAFGWMRFAQHICVDLQQTMKFLKLLNVQDLMENTYILTYIKNNQFS